MIIGMIILGALILVDIGVTTVLLIKVVETKAEITKGVGVIGEAIALAKSAERRLNEAKTKIVQTMVSL